MATKQPAKPKAKPDLGALVEKAKRPKTGGRKKGTPNKVNAQLREMILGALDEAGGQDYLKVCAYAEPKAFLALLGRVLPTTLASDPSAPFAFTATTKLEDVPEEQLIEAYERAMQAASKRKQ